MTLTTLSDPNVRPAELVLQRVGLHHFAFLKGFLEGLDLRSLAQRYLETYDSEDLDLREVIGTLNWIRGELRILCKRHGKPSIGRVIMINPDQLVDVATNKIPSLDEFREERDPYEMYSEADLIELFQDEYGTQQPQLSSKLQRNIRLRQRQSEALVWLHAKVNVLPNMDDPLSTWLLPNLAKKLSINGIETIGELVGLINERGFRWHGNVSSLGEKSAARIMRWLDLNKESLTACLSQVAFVKHSELDIDTLKKTRPKQHGIVPLEYFRPRPELDGSHGDNRGDRNKTGSNTDYDAIQLWLSTHPRESHTWRSYRKEAERFLLWSLLERGKPISSMNTADCLAYRDFMWDLGRISRETWNTIYKIDEDRWLGSRSTERWTHAWRPFEKLKSPKAPKTIPKNERAEWERQHTVRNGILSLSSQRLAQTILKSMCEWLTRQRYLDSNPWDGIKPRMPHAPEIAAYRSFTQDQWRFLMRFLDDQPRDGNYYRLHFLMVLGYATGLRLSEITGALRSDLRYKPATLSRKSGWILKVLGKGSKAREVPFPSAVMDVFLDYLAHRGYPTFDEAPADCPLVDYLTDMHPNMSKLNDVPTKVRAQAKMSDSAIYHSLKLFFKRVAADYARTNPEEAKAMAEASTHWLRHTSGSHAVANNVPIEVIQSNFGHASVDTTSIYITAEIDRRMTEMENFAEKMLRKS